MQEGGGAGRYKIAIRFTDAERSLLDGHPACPAELLGRVGLTGSDTDAVRMEFNIGQSWHRQCIHQTAILTRKPSVILHAEQHVRGPAPIGDEHRA